MRAELARPWFIYYGSTYYGDTYHGYTHQVRAEFARLWGGGLGGKAAGELREQGY